MAEHKVKKWITIKGKHVPIYEDDEDLWEDIDKAPNGTTFKNYGGLTKQYVCSGYHGSIGARINNHLRNGEPLSEFAQQVVDVMDSKMEEIRSPIKVDREVSPSYFNFLGFNINAKSTPEEIVEALKEETFTDNGYASSSYKPHRPGWRNYNSGKGVPIHLKIHCPTGTPAYLTSNKNEHEITLGRGLTYTIKDIKVQTVRDPYSVHTPKLITEVVAIVQVKKREKK